MYCNTQFVSIYEHNLALADLQIVQHAAQCKIRLYFRSLGLDFENRPTSTSCPSASS